MRKTTKIFGYNFICDTSYDQLADEIVNDVDTEKPFLAGFITPNAHGINSYLKYPDLNAYSKSCKYVLPDGQPLVWLSKFTSHPIKKRLTGSDFFPVIFNKIKAETFKCMFVVSNEELKNKFNALKPGASFNVPEFFTLGEQEKINSICDEITNEIFTKNINYVFIGISEPKQGALGQNVSQKLRERGYQQSCVFFFLGASFEFFFGQKKRAPLFFRKFGLEWFYRLFSEPRRMFKRYVFGNFIFVLRSIHWIINKSAYN